MKEKCAACGKESEYDRETDIKFRMYYVEGAGQLCKDCWEEVYKEVGLK